MGLWNKITDNILNIIDLPNFSSEGAYSLRHNGVVLCQGDTEFVKIRQKTDKPGMDVFISGKAKGETVHVPVVVDSSGITDIVNNDFISKQAQTLPSFPAAESITAAVTKTAMMEFTHFMYRKAQLSATKKSIMEKGTEPEQKS